MFTHLKYFYHGSHSTCVVRLHNDFCWLTISTRPWIFFKFRHSLMEAIRLTTAQQPARRPSLAPRLAEKQPDREKLKKVSARAAKHKHKLTFDRMLMSSRVSTLLAADTPTRGARLTQPPWLRLSFVSPCCVQRTNTAGK